MEFDGKIENSEDYQEDSLCVNLVRAQQALEIVSVGKLLYFKIIFKMIFLVPFTESYT